MAIFCGQQTGGLANLTLRTIGQTLEQLDGVNRPKRQISRTEGEARMVRMGEFAGDDGVSLAVRVARGEVSAPELAEAALEAISAVNPEINAVLQTLPEAADRIRKGSHPSGPLAGVPFLLKEDDPHEAGVKARAGSFVGADYSPGHDSVLMQRFRQAGLVTVGTTQTPEWAFNATTEPVRFGACRNPWNLEHSAGGSSGGAAAAVAAGIVPVAHASDGGGSIRIPASSCGIFGLKPTRLRTPSGPNNGDLLWGLAIDFVVSRSVRDSAVLLDALAGPDPGAPHFPPAPGSSFAAAAARPRKGLRIAFHTSAPSGVAVHSDCVAAVEDAARLCDTLGHNLEEAAPPLDWEPYLAATLNLWNSYLHHAINGFSAATGVAIGPESMEMASLACWEAGRKLRATDILESLSVINRVSRDFAEFFRKYDVLLSPALARPPLPLGVLDQNAEPDAAEWGRQIFAYAAFTSQFNATGQPAMSVPLYWNTDGLPVGAHFAGRFGDEATLLGLAAELEAARPWMNRRPPVRV